MSTRPAYQFADAPKDVRRSMVVLWTDAKTHGLTDLCMLYSMSAIRLGLEVAAGQRKVKRLDEQR